MKETIVPTSRRGAKYKKMNLFANIMFVTTIAGVGNVYGFNYYEDCRRSQLYDALHMTFSEVREVEYGSDTDSLSFVESFENGEIGEYTEELDTASVGVKELKYELVKDDVSKEYTIEVLVKDTKKPSIAFKYNTITLYVGNTYAYKNNIKSVKDEVDGDLPYSDKDLENSETGYYTITSNLNNKKIGTYTVTVKAVDKNGNETVGTYNIKVIAKPTPKKTTTTTTKTTKTTTSGSYKGPSSVDTSSVVAAAKSLLGSKYVYGQSSPSTGFDCSGLISYIYRLFGKELSRTAAGMAKNGRAVAYEDMQPGDIIVWSHRSDNVPTHVALYIGNGEMIHAANKRKGVIQSSIEYWKDGGRNKIVSIRRV